MRRGGEQGPPGAGSAGGGALGGWSTVGGDSRTSKREGRPGGGYSAAPTAPPPAAAASAAAAAAGNSSSRGKGRGKGSPVSPPRAADRASPPSPPRAPPPRELQAEWAERQRRLLEKAVAEDTEGLEQRCAALRGAPRGGGEEPQPLLVGGVDLSFTSEHKGAPAAGAEAVAALVVMAFAPGKAPRVVHESYLPVTLDQPYIPGFLAFRESPPLERLISGLRSTEPHLMPHVLLVDGNGRIHPRKCGLATHLGVCAGLPTVGVAKKLLVCRGLTDDDSNPVVSPKDTARMRAADLPTPPPLRGMCRALRDSDGSVLGVAYRGGSPQKCRRPHFVSCGNRTSLAAALAVVEATTRPQLSEPEPVRYADRRGRHLLTLSASGELPQLKRGKRWVPPPGTLDSAPMLDDRDMPPCPGCGSAWVLQAGEQEFCEAMRRKGRTDWKDPTKCKGCRAR